MNTKQLQYFLVTADKGSITASARALDVAQPAISLQLANLEHELKIKLFERDFRGVQLTREGERFKQHAQTIMQQIQIAKDDMGGSRNDFKGTVTLALDQAVCNVLSVDLLTELEHRFPNIELQLRIGPSHVVEQWVKNKAIDIAITYQPTKTESALQSIALIRENLYLVISRQPKNPAYSELAQFASVPFQDLQHYEIFINEEQDALTELLNHQAESYGFTLKRKNAFGQLMTTLHYVSQGFGLVVLPSSAVFHLENSNQVRCLPIIRPELQRDVYIQVVDSKNKMDPATSGVASVVELIREVSANMHANNSWRGTLIDKKYANSKWNQIETLISA